MVRTMSFGKTRERIPDSTLDLNEVEGKELGVRWELLCFGTEQRKGRDCRHGDDADQDDR